MGGINLPGAALTVGRINANGGIVDVGGGIVVAGGATFSGSLRGISDITASGYSSCTDGFFGSKVEVSNAKIAGIITTIHQFLQMYSFSP